MNMSFTANIRRSIETPDQKKFYNQGLFSRVASEYNIATRAMSLGQDARWKRRLIAALPCIENPRCVDLACGTGDVTLALAKRFPHGEIVGVDLTEPMIEIARARAGDRALRIERGDMCQLSLPDGWADIVTGSYAIRNAPVLDDALREISRVLKPDGVAAFLDFAKPSAPWRAKLQLTILKYWCGLVSILVHGRPEHAYIAESMRQFPHRAALRQRMLHHGLRPIHTETFMLGALEILLVQKFKV